MSFWRRNLGFSQLAIQQQLEYRTNFVVDAFVQPLIAVIFEILLWIAVFKGAQTTEIAGFSLESYLSYALWGTFFARISANWMYEHRMIEQINSGQINSLLIRPTNFFEYFLFQFLGYKILIMCLSLALPGLAVFYLDYPTFFYRLPLAALLAIFFLVFTYCLSFLISTFAFQFNKIHAFTFSKNITLWILTGELFPLDLLPSPLKEIFIASPFSAGVYLPVGYLTGRFGESQILQGFLSVSLGILFLGLIGSFHWKRSLKIYSGTGA